MFEGKKGELSSRAIKDAPIIILEWVIFAHDIYYYIFVHNLLYKLNFGMGKFFKRISA